MPCLDAKALENDPEGMAFLRSVLKPDAAEARPAPARLRPTLASPAMIASADAPRPERVRRVRRAPDPVAG